MDLVGAEIFSTGTWNGYEVTGDTLNSLVRSFEDAGLSGRVPLKFGHDVTGLDEGDPAVGWVKRVYRKGRKLLADFTDIPKEVYELIRKGAYKFCSIELLQNAEHEGVKYPAVLDAVALLGASPPAVTNLADLQRLTAARTRPAFTCESRAEFTRGLDLVEDDAARIAALEAENATLKGERETFGRRATDAEAALNAERAGVHQRDILGAMEQLVVAGRLTPAARDRLIKTKQLRQPSECLKFSREDLDVYALAVGERHGFARRANTAAVRGIDGSAPGAPAAALIEAAKLTFAQQPMRTVEWSAKPQPAKDFIQVCIDTANGMAEHRSDRDAMFSELFRNRPR
jgi:hypothetical protein